MPIEPVVGNRLNAVMGSGQAVTTGRREAADASALFFFDGAVRCAAAMVS